MLIKTNQFLCKAYKNSVFKHSSMFATTVTNLFIWLAQKVILTIKLTAASTIALIQIIYSKYQNYAKSNPSPTAIAKQDIKTRYKKQIQFYNEMSDYEANSNINTDLYDYEKRKTIFSEINNEQEKQWKSRILQERTDYGNIIMYYDCYRMTFTYYSDEQVIPYESLYYAALKYVVLYRCRNFFIDMDTFPDNPILNVLKKEDEQMKTKTKKQTPAPTHKTITKKQQLNTSQLKPAPKPFTNKFTRIGKICEFNIIQKPPNKNIKLVNSLLFNEKKLTTMKDFFDELEITESESLFTSETYIDPVEQLNKLSDYQKKKSEYDKLSDYQKFKLKHKL